MSSNYEPGLEYYSHAFKLTGTGETTVYTVGDEGEQMYADLQGISVTASTGVAGVCTLRWYRSGVVFAVLVYQGDVPSKFPLEVEGIPCISLKFIGTTADYITAEGANLQHVILTFVKGNREQNTPAPVPSSRPF